MRATGENAGDTTGTTDVADGVVHSARVTWETDNLKLYVDGTQEGSTDVDCGVPDNIDEIDIGSYGGISHTKAIISDLKIWSFITLKS